MKDKTGRVPDWLLDMAERMHYEQLCRFEKVRAETRKEMNDELIALALRVEHLEAVKPLNQQAATQRTTADMKDGDWCAEVARHTAKHVASVNLCASRAVAEYAKCDGTSAAILIAAIAAGRIPGVSIAY